MVGADALQDLPPKIIQDLLCDLSPLQARPSPNTLSRLGLC